VAVAKGALVLLSGGECDGRDIRGGISRSNCKGRLFVQLMVDIDSVDAQYHHPICICHRYF
jgi:hypothetical protein